MHRATAGALDALAYLNGHEALPSSGKLTGDQIYFLIGQLYKADGSLQSFVTKGTFDQAAQNIVYAASYLKSLRGTAGALEALAYLNNNTALPSMGKLTGDQIDF